SMICGWNSGDSRSDEIKVFDYIYGILHCPEYRKTHAELLKTAFPRVPFPANPGVFSRVSAQGESLRRLHLMEDSAVGIAQYPFEGEGHCVVVKPRFVDGCVWINASQYFAGVPLVAWEFPIGGYLPAQRWLKDRKGRVLGSGDVRHYSRIIRVLAETCRIMHEIRLA
ncbi:MAG: hypothetical protein FWD57_12490, partial [Polyangiaceae bacterium]|nr:hypothetical protein [Polyangiaceae bacterium]